MDRLARIWRWIADWRRAAFVLRSPLIRIVAVIPALGYAILYSDGLVTFLSTNTTLGEPLFFSTLVRIHLLFFGALALLASLGLYAVFCPAPVKRFSTAEEYVDECIRLQRMPSSVRAITDVLNARYQGEAGDAYACLQRILQQTGANPGLIADFDRHNSQRLGAGAPPKPTASFVRDAAKHFVIAHEQLYSRISFSTDLAAILEMHFEVMATTAKQWAIIACIVMCYVGLLMFFAPTFETMLRIIALWL